MDSGRTLVKRARPMLHSWHHAHGMRASQTTCKARGRFSALLKASLMSASAKHAGHHFAPQAGAGSIAFLPA